MYEAFYGFKEKPFSMLPDPSFLFLSKKHRAALTLLEYGLMNQVGFCILSGEPGAGKTTILRALLNRVDDNVRVGLISNTHQSFGGLLDWILSAFDLHKANLTQVEMHQLFVDFLIEEYGKNRRVLLIVDEAQNMDPASLEELRMLSNVNTEKDQLLQVVLAGQPQLKENLRKPELSQFAQRIAVDYHLHSLNLNETCGYIQHRLVVAGAERDVFTPGACERVHCYSGGSPRLINLLCETALVYGFADEKDLIDADLVEEMVHERMEDSVVPLANLNGENDGESNKTDQLVKDFPWIRPEGGTKGLKPEVKARLAEIEQSKKTVKPEPEISGTTLPPLSASQSPEPELPLPNDLISTAERLGEEVVSDVVDEQAGDGVVQEEKTPQDDVSLKAENKKESVVSEPVVSETVTPEPIKPESVKNGSSQNGSTQVRDAYEKEINAKNQIKAARSKSNVFKYLIYTGIAVLGLAIASFFYSDYARDFSVFDSGEQVHESDKQAPMRDQAKDNFDPDVKMDGVIQHDTKDNSENNAIKKLEQERLEQEQLKKEKLEQEALEKARLEQERLEQEKLEQERLEQEKLEQEKAAKQQLEKEQAAQLEAFRAQERREARAREAEAKRRIARQIKQREAELAAQEQARRQRLEADRIAKEQREAAEKLKQQEEARRLQNEWLEKEREKLRELEAIEAPKVKKTQSFSDEGFTSKTQKKTFANCDGPAARFKTECR